ncbi:protein BCL9 homolog isoform X2 [Planococcus citri]|uniref:protein BCL9 homolog isoform X2 n=1 Tax=Planococcus citri TaxID=170843 RepID=UPI0031F74531
MAMIKEKQKDKCGSADKKAKLDGNTFNSNLSAACKSQVKTEDIISTDADFSPDFMLDGPLSSCKPHKTEDVMNSDPGFPPDSCNSMLSSVPMNVGSSDPMVDGMQPLSSNVMNKQPSTIDAQYMQQQSQVFVFSSQLANKSADSVIQGEYPSIIAYHCAQQNTKKFLEKNSHKVNQFNRQNSAPWMNNIGPMKQKHMPVGPNRCGVGRGGFRGPMMGPNMMNHAPGMPGSPAGMNMPPRLPMWNQQGNMNPMNVNNAANQHGGHMMSPMCNNNVMPGSGPPGGPMQPQMNPVLPGQMGPNTGPMMHGVGMPPMKCPSQPSSMDMMAGDSNTSNQLLSNNVLPNLGNFTDDQLPLSPQTSLIGVKVPDENLTPEQKMHRKEQLETLRKLGEMLLPEAHHQQQQQQQAQGSGPGQPQSTPHHGMPSDMQPSVHNQLSADDISSVLGGPGPKSGPGPGGVPTSTPPGGAVPPGGPGSGPGGMDPGDMSNLQKTVSNPSAAAHADWQKMQPFFDDRKRKATGDVAMGRCGSTSGPRSQGPPPPYHQTTRSASVPIAIPSPNPNSPGNATSNLSLPSPRTCSGLNSPASKQGPGPSPTTNQLNTSIESPSHRGMNISNPGTPVSSTMHLSPNSKQKEAKMCGGPLSNEFSPATSGQQSPDGIYCRTLQSLAQQQQQKQQPQLPHNQQMQPGGPHCKEPNLMPVPSPQHIQYLNAFEGQELTIQKQPNTSLKDTTSIVSPSLSTAALDTIIPPVTSSDGSCTKVSVSAPNTPLTPTSLDLGARYPGTPADFSELSPNAGGGGGGGGPDSKSNVQQLRGGPNNSNQMKNDLRFACSSPQMSDQQRYPPGGPGGFMGGPGGPGNKPNFMDVSSPDKMSCTMGGGDGKDPGSCSGPGGPGDFGRRIGSDNVPLNPSMNTTSKPSQFDPISSLAQMSQQLTNNVPGSPGQQPGGGPMMHGGMMPYNSAGGHMPNNMHMMQMNEMGMCGGGPGPGPGGGGPGGGGPGGDPQMPPDGSRMMYNPQMGPGMNPMHGGGPMGNSIGPPGPGQRMMPCPQMGNDGPPGGPGGPKGPPGGMMQNPYPPMMGGNSPRMMGRPPGPGGPMPNSYNGANIQVKPNAPNTIQYLPNRPQSTSVGPRGPPSLEFLQRFSNPAGMPPHMENKMSPSHNMNYFPNNYAGGPGPGPGPGGPGPNMNEMMGQMNCNMPPGANPATAAMIRAGMRPPPQGGPPPPSMMRMGNMGMPPYGNEQMYPPGPGGPPNPNMPNNNCHMFMPNSGPNKMPSMGMGGGVAPDATQPLPPSIGQSNNFKNSPFIGPTTADPNYAQQFHNFQQQLYATNTRSTMNNQSMAGTNQQYFVPK